MDGLPRSPFHIQTAPSIPLPVVMYISVKIFQTWNIINTFYIKQHKTYLKVIK